jgi:hypothetical protein
MGQQSESAHQLSHCAALNVERGTPYLAAASDAYLSCLTGSAHLLHIATSTASCIHQLAATASCIHQYVDLLAAFISTLALRVKIAARSGKSLRTFSVGSGVAGGHWPCLANHLEIECLSPQSCAVIVITSHSHSLAASRERR